MPIYEFVCRECGAQFEHLQSFSAKGHPPCPQCSSMHVSRLLGKPAIHFKGSGWYVTDSKGASKQGAHGETGKEGAGKEGAPVKAEPAAEGPSRESTPKEESPAAAKAGAAPAAKEPSAPA